MALRRSQAWVRLHPLLQTRRASRGCELAREMHIRFLHPCQCNALVLEGLMSTIDYVPEKWSEEQTRYQFLQLTYERAGRLGETVISSESVGSALGFRFGEVLRVVSWLERNGYVHCYGSGRFVSVSPAGTKYLEETAGDENPPLDFEISPG